MHRLVAVLGTIELTVPAGLAADLDDQVAVASWLGDNPQ